MKRTNPIVFLLILTVSMVCFSQQTSQSQLLLSKAFGFVHGQQHILNKIKTNYSSLTKEVELAQLEFDNNFGRAVYEINKETKKTYGDSYNAFLTKFVEGLNKNFKDNKSSKKNASLFIENVKKRAKGQIPSPVLETLLAYQYHDNPVEELSASYYQIYSVKSYSNGLNSGFKIKMPKSWKGLNSNSGSILKKFRSENGTGNEIITISKDKLSNIKKERTQLVNNINRKFFTHEELKGLIPKGSKIISIDTKIINDNLTGVLQYEEVNGNQKRYIIQYVLSSQQNLIKIECAIYGTLNDNLNEKFQKFAPLYQSIFKSIKLNKEPNYVRAF